MGLIALGPRRVHLALMYEWMAAGLPSGRPTTIIHLDRPWTSPCLTDWEGRTAFWPSRSGSRPQRKTGRGVVLVYRTQLYRDWIDQTRQQLQTKCCKYTLALQEVSDETEFQISHEAKKTTGKFTDWQLAKTYYIQKCKLLNLQEEYMERPPKCVAKMQTLVQQNWRITCKHRKNYHRNKSKANHIK